MSGIKIPAALKVWSKSTVPEGSTSEEKHEIVTQKLTEKLVDYQVEYRVKLGLQDGSLSIPDGCTVESIVAKSDEASVNAFNDHCTAILAQCVVDDIDL